MRPYSIDLRRKVMCALEEEDEKTEAIADRFGVAGSTVRKWRLRVRAGVGLEPTKHPGRMREFTQAHDEQLAQAVRDQSDATRQELARTVGEALGRVFSAPVITRALQRLGFTRKKSPSPRASNSARMSKRRGRRGGSTRSSRKSTV